MKNKLIASMLTLMFSFAASGALAANGTSRFDSLDEIGVVNLDISGNSARSLYNQFKKWGAQEESCPEDKIVTAVTGPGFTCFKNDKTYFCATVIMKDGIFNSPLACPAPSMGVGN